MPKRYLSPTFDITFKRMLGSEKYNTVTIDFLNAVLEKTGSERIKTVEFANPINQKNDIGDKLSTVDVRCTDQNGTSYIVEMQVVKEEGFAKRCQYYVARAIASQLRSRGQYETLLPVVFVGIVDHTLFSNELPYLTHIYLTESTTNQRLLGLSSYHFIELEKFTKTEIELVDSIDRWVYLMKNAHLISDDAERNMLAAGNQEILQAFDALDESNMTLAEQEAYFYEENMYRVELGRKMAAEKEGIERGRQEGMQEGMHQKSLAIAKVLLEKGLSVELVAESTGLSVDEIKKLA